MFTVYSGWTQQTVFDCTCFFANVFIGGRGVYSGQVQLDWFKWASSSLQTGNWYDSGSWARYVVIGQLHPCHISLCNHFILTAGLPYWHNDVFTGVPLPKTALKRSMLTVFKFVLSTFKLNQPLVTDAIRGTHSICVGKFVIVLLI